MTLLALLLACGCVVDAAVASPAVLDAAYGNVEGCRYAGTGEAHGADAFFRRNDHGITTAASSCAFQSAAKKTAKGFSIRLRCEGGTGSGEMVSLEKSKTSYIVRFADGNTRGPLAKCR